MTTNLLQQFQAAYCEGPAVIPPGKPALKMVERFAVDGDPAKLSSCTFRHVAHYMRTGEESSRLPVALKDFQLDKKVLDERRAKGDTAVDIAREVLIRWPPDHAEPRQPPSYAQICSG